MAYQGEQKEQEKLDYYEAESHVRVYGSIGGLTSFNAEYGFLEAMLRGFRSGFLKENEYRQLCQCATLEDVKLTLGDTDLCNVLASTQQLTPDIIQERVWAKYVAEFQFLRNQAVGQLATFMDMITYETLISNISFLITGLIRGAKPDALLAKCDPLGFFPRLKGVLTFDNTKDGLVELYKTVLVDTPVAPYFEEFFDVELSRDEPLKEIERVYNEVEIDVITNRLQKFWLEDFYRYCKQLGGETALMMKELLEFEADRRSISITLNSFKTPLSETHDMREKRRELYPDLGKLYPEGLDSFKDVTTEEQLGDRLKPYPIYYKLFQSYKVSREHRSFPDALYWAEVQLNRLAFDSQSHFACFWAYGRLKQQEKRNIWWIMSCIHEERDPKEFGRWMKIF